MYVHDLYIYMVVAFGNRVYFSLISCYERIVEHTENDDCKKSWILCGYQMWLSIIF